MSMDFCPKCGKLLQTEKNKKGNTVVICFKCGYKRQLEEDENITLTEEIKHDMVKEMTVVLDETDIDTSKPIKEMYCPRCEQNRKVSFWMIQTRSADESPTRFFRCTVCSETWREYD
ncbi:MAG: transcription factor S [Candidatus Heimdallarchaeaceae archaeon]|jgi:DNA-directed RNA polymerase subunit M